MAALPQEQPFFYHITAKSCPREFQGVAMQQFTLDFQAGLTERFPRWEDTLVHAVYSCRLGLNGVAGKLDQSPSDLCKRLAGEESRPLRTKDVLGIIEATGDHTPIFWLLEKFLKDPDAKKQEALARLPGLMAALESTLAQAGGPKLKAVAR
jgi:hypothetical protein